MRWGVALLLLLGVPWLTYARTQLKELVHGKLIDFPTYPLEASTQEPWMIRQTEIDRKLVIPPLPCWGQQMRRERSLRILVLGGSNTAEGNGKPQDRNWVNFLKKSLVKEFPELVSSVLWNSAVKGQGVTYSLYRSYSFEYGPVSEWPNLVILEPNVNCVTDEGCAANQDAVVFTLNSRWAMHGLDPPSYLFLELFNFGGLYVSMKGQEDTEINRLRALICADKKDHRKPHLTGFARFFHIPMLSFADVASPAVFRHFMHANVSDMWPYSHEGCHLNQFGHRFVNDHLVIPFLKDQLSPRREVSPSSADCSPYGSLPLTYFDPASYAEFTSTTVWSLWNRDRSLLRLVTNESSSDWRVVDLRGHPDGAHQCYGSTVANSKVQFQIHVPKACGSQQVCDLSLEYLHSWNTSYIGSAQCSVHKRGHHKAAAQVRVTSDRHHDVPVEDTVPRKVLLLATISSGGHHTVECAGVDADRLACISGVFLTHLKDEKHKNHV